MKLLQALPIVAMLNVCICHAAPTPESHDWETDPEFTGGFFEGDIIPDIRRNGVNTVVRYWPDGKIYYKFDSIFDDEHRAAIRSAMDAIEAPTCVRFVEVMSTAEQPHYVKITGDKIGCNAQVGNLRREQRLHLQLAPLNTGCFVRGKIMHELLHAVGFFHMHSAPNRDLYVRIVAENILDGGAANFRKMKLNDFGVAYDYASMLHYPAQAWSKNGLPTIVALQPLRSDVRMGQRDAMTASDILKINRMYRCFEEEEATTTEGSDGSSTAATTIETETSSGLDDKTTVY